VLIADEGRVDLNFQEIIIYSNVTMGKPTKPPCRRIYLQARVGTEEVFVHTKYQYVNHHTNQHQLNTNTPHGKRKTMTREKIVAKK